MTTTAPPNRSRTGRTVALIVAGTVVVALIAWLVVGAVRATTRPDASGTWEIDERFDSVVLEGDLADVDITYRDIDRSELTLRQGDSRARLDLDHEVRGDTLHVSLRHVREIGLPQWWPWPGARGPRLELVLPASLEQDVALDMSTDVGDIRATGGFGGVTARSDVGDIELHGSAASVDLRTSTGDIDVTRVSTAGAMTVQSRIGDLTLALDALPDGIDVRTETGEVTVNLPEGRYDVTADTSIGDLELAVANDPSATRHYEFTSGIGDISIGN